MGGEIVFFGPLGGRGGAMCGLVVMWWEVFGLVVCLLRQRTPSTCHRRLSVYDLGVVFLL